MTEVPPLHQLEQRTVYVSMPYSTTVHLCACGCGSEVVNILSPTDWQLSFDGEAVSLHPSINNSSLACASHYWIDHDQIFWSTPVAPGRVAELRTADQRAKRQFYTPAKPEAAASTPEPRRNLLSRLTFWRRRPRR